MISKLVHHPLINKYVTELKNDQPFVSLLYHHLRGRKGGSRRQTILDALKRSEDGFSLELSDAVQQPSTDQAHLAVWDFGVKPYALGDILSWNLLTVIHAIRAGKSRVDIAIVLDPLRPNMPAQGYITSQNYMQFFLELEQAFYFNPMLGNLHIYKDRLLFEEMMILKNLKKESMEPSLTGYTNDLHNCHQGYSFYHHEFNEFYDEYGYVPKFKAPVGFENVAKELFSKAHTESFVVAVHLRQRKNMNGTFRQSDLLRDSDQNNWLAFFKWALNEYPFVMFALVGRIDEYPREMMRMRNVVFLKSCGMGLSHELSLISEADLFMGSNSGPAMMAIYSDTPYLIYQSQSLAEQAASNFGIPLGTESLPYANDHQKIKWTEDTIDTLIQDFESMYKLLV